MSPKFSGDGDDWLDDENSRSRKSAGGRKKKAPQARAIGLPPEEANAVVAEVFPNQCGVKMDGTGLKPLCSYRRAGVVSKDKSGKEVRERSPVAVGDRVLVLQTGDSTGVIEGICTRKNSLSRPAPGREGTSHAHVLAANVDFLVIVASAAKPEFSSGLVDRFLVAAEAEGIPVVLCVSKIDLMDNPSAQPPWGIYRELGYAIFEVSGKNHLGLEPLLQLILGKTVVFCGHSGVGKTSLLRGLLKADVGRIGEVNEQTGKGRHTTTGAILLGGPEGSQWIDTPGIRAFGLANIPPEKLSQNFPEFRGLQCAQVGCYHLDEEGCLAKTFPRYEAYRRILQSLLAGEN